MSLAISVEVLGTTSVVIATPGSETDLTLTTGSETLIEVTGGAPGPAGERVSFIAAAGEALGGHRVVHIDSYGLAYLADPSTAVAKRPVGLTAGAVIEGANVQILTGDDIDEVSWNWAPGAVYLGAAGTLTQTPPTTDAVYLVGIAAGPTRLRITPSLIAQL